MKRKLTEKMRAEIVSMRQEGKTYRAIGKKFGINEVWARQVAYTTRKRMAPPDEISSLKKDLEQLAVARRALERREKEIGIRVKKVFGL